VDFDGVLLDLLAAGYGVRFQARGKSMAPSIRDGEAVTVVPVKPEAVRRWDVILYSTVFGAAAHRVVGGGHGAPFQVRGDASGSEPETVEASRLLGTVVSVERNGRRVPFGTPGARLRHAILRLGNAAAEAVRPLVFSQPVAR